MTYHKHTLKNGLRLITVPMASVSSATVMILVGVGSRYEEEAKNGVTHFLEHMVFKGTKKRPTAQEILVELDSIGAESNASTSKESTAYYIRAQTTHFPRMFDTLSELVTQPLLAPREIEREKGVILSEIAMYEDTPLRRVSDLFEMLLYPNSPLGWDITGTPESVNHITQEDFFRLYEDFYYPENVVVAVAGGVQERETQELAEKYFGKLKAKNPKGKVEKETFIQEEPRVLVKEKKTEQAHFIVGLRANPRAHKDRWSEEVLSAVLGSGKSSRLWLKVREQAGLAYEIHSEVEHYKDNGYLAVYAGVKPGKIERTLELILSEIKALEKGKRLTAKELGKAKEYIKGNLTLTLENTRNVAGFFGAFELLEDGIVTPEQVRERIDKVTGDDIVRVANEFFVPERLNLAVIGPYKDDRNFRKVLKL